MTICVHQRRHLFGKIVQGEMNLGKAGEMVRDVWLRLFDRFDCLQTDSYVIMPDHFHAVFNIQQLSPQQMIKRSDGLITIHSLFDIVGAFKSISTVKYIEGVQDGRFVAFNKKLWHRGYHEAILRDERSLRNVRRYIMNNPINWTLKKG